jgi:hypothetical protein
MENMSLKGLAEKFLRGNHQRNFLETKGFHTEKPSDAHRNRRVLIGSRDTQKLSHDEIQFILDGYVREAKKLFAEEPEKKTVTHERATVVQERLL